MKLLVLTWPISCAVQGTERWCTACTPSLLHHAMSLAVCPEKCAGRNTKARDESLQHAGHGLRQRDPPAPEHCNLPSKKGVGQQRVIICILTCALLILNGA